VTYQYYLGSSGDDPWPVVHASELATSGDDTPYNTYKSKGWIPSAIGSVSPNALYAGIDPPSTKYYYFIFGRVGCQNYYASTDYQHQQNIQKYGVALTEDCKA
jgi:UPF0755 protein